MKNITAKRLVVLIIVALIALFLVFERVHRKGDFGALKQKTPQTSPISSTNSIGSNAGDGLVRNPRKIHYSKHARCRMACRQIEETEVMDILAKGQINFRKSELNNAECHNRYAVEGRTKDGQEVRIIFAPCGEEETVVTVIDLRREWSCDCK